MLSLILALACAQPPQSTLREPSPWVITDHAKPACKCGDSCPCKAAPMPPVVAPVVKQSLTTDRITATDGKTYTRRANGQYWLEGQEPTTSPAATSSPAASGCPGGVCPVPARRR